MRHAAIASVGRYVPARRVTNAEMGKELGEDVHEWLVANVGIEARHFMAPDEVTSDLAVKASQQALARAELSADALDLIIVATDTPDYVSPGTSSVVQAKLAAHNAGTFDINCACASWVTALDMGSKHLMVDATAKHVLVVGAYGMSRFLNPKDKKTATLFADGAGAVVLKASSEPGYLGSRLTARGDFHDALGVYVGGTSRPATLETVREHGTPHVEFVRRFPPTFNTEHWPLDIHTLLSRAGLTLEDVKLFVFTQLNLRTIEKTMAILGQPMSKAHWTMDKWGYTGSACIPMTLDDAVEHGRLRAGDHVLFCASGGGLTMASALFRWTA